VQHQSMIVTFWRFRKSKSSRYIPEYKDAYLEDKFIQAEVDLD
jgi:hypothetical protein